MTQDASNFWQHHSLHFLEMAFRTDKREIVAQPDGHGKKSGDCGDTVEIFLQLGPDRQSIGAVSYHTDGCLNTNACANTVAHLIEGKRIDDAWNVTPEDVAAFLETLPPDHFHCAELAVGALYLALADLAGGRRQGWKRLYHHP
jgi:nitrogen fixation NifU-like protein